MLKDWRNHGQNRGCIGGGDAVGNQHTVSSGLSKDDVGQGKRAVGRAREWRGVEAPLIAQTAAKSLHTKAHTVAHNVGLTDRPLDNCRCCGCDGNSWTYSGHATDRGTDRGRPAADARDQSAGIHGENARVAAGPVGRHTGQRDIGNLGKAALDRGLLGLRPDHARAGHRHAE